MQQSLNLSSDLIQELQDKKNLLAFSGGVDSSCLFFLLLEKNIDFDLALVNYKTRKNSDIEENHAVALSKKYNKKIFIKTCILEVNNFEQNARNSRYSFFEEIIKNHSYENLLTAHQLNDKFEWMLMQFTKGCGCVELKGFSQSEQRQGFKLLRPLINTKRSDILKYLEERNLPYFVDISNFDTKHKRNYFRTITDQLVESFSNGIKRSFELLEEDSKFLINDFYLIKKDLYIFKNSNEKINLRMVDKACKNLGVLLSQKQREEIIKQKNGVISGKIAFGFNDEFGYICPSVKNILSKKSKENFRVLKIPKYIRPYLYKFNLKI